MAKTPTTEPPSQSCWFTGTEGDIESTFLETSSCCWSWNPTVKATDLTMLVGRVREDQPLRPSLFSLVCGLLWWRGQARKRLGKAYGAEMSVNCNISAKNFLGQIIYCLDSLPQKARNHEVWSPFKIRLCLSPWNPTGCSLTLPTQPCNAEGFKKRRLLCPM